MSSFYKLVSLILVLGLTLLSSPLPQGSIAVAAQRAPEEASIVTVELTVTRTSTTHLTVTAKAVESGYPVTVDYEFNPETQEATSQFTEGFLNSQIRTTVEYKSVAEIDGKRWIEILVNGQTMAQVSSDQATLKLPDNLPLNQPIKSIITVNPRDLASRISAGVTTSAFNCTDDYWYDNVRYMQGNCWNDQIGDGVAYTHPNYLYYHIPSWGDQNLRGGLFYHVQKGARTVEKWDATVQGLAAIVGAIIGAFLGGVLGTIVGSVVGAALGWLGSLFLIALKDERGAIWFRFDIHPECQYWLIVRFRDIAVGPYDLGGISVTFPCW